MQQSDLPLSDLAENTFYTPKEEFANRLTHGIGLALSIGGLAMLLYLASWYGEPRHVVAFTIYGITLIFLFLASTLYHSVVLPETKRVLRLVDHVAIFLVIAGTYTPLMLLGVTTSRGMILLVIIWVLAILGTGFKLLVHDPHRFENFSLATYLGMGWMFVFIARDILATVSPNGVIALIAGGLLYTFGTIFYRWDSLPFNHAIWHIFVLAASACHFFSILSFVWVI